MRPFAALASLALVTAACGGQSAPERPPVDIPTEIVPDSIVATNPADVYPSSEECLVGVGTGARVLLISDGGAAEGLINPGDIITSIDGVAVGSEEALRRAMRDHAPGDVVNVAGTRSTEPFAAAVTLTDGGDGIGVMGLVVETRLEPTIRTELPPLADLEPQAQPVVVNNNLFMHDPVNGSWSPLNGIPAPTMASVEDRVFSLTQEDALAIVDVGSGEVLSIANSPFIIEFADSTVTLNPRSFQLMLGSVGGTLVVAGDALDTGGNPVIVLYGIDPVTRVVTWNEAFTLSEAGNPRAPTIGHRSPDGERIAVGIVEQDRSTGARTGLVGYLIFDEAGRQSLVPGFDSVPESAFVAGWHDNTSLLFFIQAETPAAFTWNTITGSPNALYTLSQAQANGLETVQSVGDGRHSVLVYGSETLLIDAIDNRITRVASRGCSYAPLG